jgi:hypothetical protein
MRVVAPFVSTGALMAISWLATGPSLGLFFSGLFLAAVLTPPIVLIHRQGRGRLVPTSAILNGIAIIWLITCFTGTISLLQWFDCYVVLLAWCVALTGLASFLERFRIHPVFASAITITLALLWMTWPVWLSATMRNWSRPMLVHWLVQLNPPLAINGILVHLGPWTQMPMAYHLTDLGQNIAYALPTHGLACIVGHLLLGSTLLLWSARNPRALP